MSCGWGGSICVCAHRNTSACCCVCWCVYMCISMHTFSQCVYRNWMGVLCIMCAFRCSVWTVVANTLVVSLCCTQRTEMSVWTCSWQLQVTKKWVKGRKKELLKMQRNKPLIIRSIRIRIGEGRRHHTGISTINMSTDYTLLSLNTSY